MESLKKEIIKFGKKVVEKGLCTSFFGNISIRTGDKVLITATGTMLDELDNNKIIVCNLKEDKCEKASSELIVHKTIYSKNINFNAIIHTHSFYSVLLSSLDEDLNLDEYEFGDIIGEIKIVEGKSGSLKLAENIGRVALSTYIVIVRNHGVFCWGSTLTECFIRISALEFYAKMKFYKKLVIR
ncbi:class II aldolase/adducin family protein [Deferribacter abyssi]|uniref:class II aldolase/adducin family protein n=1 Tax=Deferribacter abyssi TaxID=213806 RepID=UPI003C2629FC